MDKSRQTLLQDLSDLMELGKPQVNSKVSLDSVSISLTFPNDGNDKKTMGKLALLVADAVM